MTPHFLKWSFGPKIESVDGICHQTESRNRFYLDVKTGPKSTEFASGSKIVDENKGDMENFLVTQDSTDRGFC